MRCSTPATAPGEEASGSRRTSIETIGREELKAKLDRGDDFKLVMAFGGWRFRAAHIPGSLSVSSPAEASELLRPEDEIVVYCTSRDCAASPLLYRTLVHAGYENVRRYPEGILGWMEAGYPLEGASSRP